LRAGEDPRTEDRGAARIFPPDDRVDPLPSLDEDVETAPEGERMGRDLLESFIDRRFEEDTRFSERIEGTLLLMLPDRRPEAPDTRVRELADREEERDIRAG